MSGIYKDKVLAVDFDDTLAITQFPTIVEPIYSVVNLVDNFIKEGGKVILWTCRHDEYLDMAVEYCNNELGIVFDAVNSNLQEYIDLFGDTRKIFAHYYLDDKSVKISDITDDFLISDLTK